MTSQDGSPDIRLSFVTFGTRDLGTARAFYEGVLGLRVTDEEPGDFVQLQVGQAGICIDKAATEEEPVAIFSVSDLDELCARLSAAAVPFQAPKASRRGRYVMVSDPDGRRLVFEEKAD